MKFFFQQKAAGILFLTLCAATVQAQEWDQSSPSVTPATSPVSKPTPATGVDQITIRRIKDNKALVDVPQGVVLQEGMPLYTASQAKAETRTSPFGERDIRLMLVLSNSSMEDKERKTKSSSLSADILCGYNWQRFEAGGVLNYSNSETSSTQSSSSSEDNGNGFGFFGQYNFNLHQPGVETLTYFRLTYLMLKQSLKTNSASSTANYVGDSIQAGLGIDYFPSGLAFGVSTGLSYISEVIRNDNGTTTSKKSGAKLEFAFVWML